MVKKSIHLKEVVVTRKTLSNRMYQYFDIERKRIIYLLWAIFSDIRDLFFKGGETRRSATRVHVTLQKHFLGVGLIQTNIIPVTVDQLGGEVKYSKGGYR